MPRTLGLLVAGAVSVSASTLGGCASDPSTRASTDASSAGDGGAPTVRAANATDHVRNQGYSLLYGLVTDESKVDGILMLKDASPATKELVRSIAERARRATESLDGFADADATLLFDTADLPAVERDARAAISSQTAGTLLSTSGAEFERNLLLTQYEALKYLAALSTALAERESNEARKLMLEALAADAGTLHERVVVLLAR